MGARSRGPQVSLQRVLITYSMCSWSSRTIPTWAFSYFIRLESELSDLLHVKVDLVEKAGLKPAIGRRILHLNVTDSPTAFWTGIAGIICLGPDGTTQADFSPSPFPPIVPLGTVEPHPSPRGPVVSGMDVFCGKGSIAKTTLTLAICRT